MAGKEAEAEGEGEAEAEKFFLRRCACLENALSKGWFSRGTSCSDFEGQLLSWGYSCVCSPGAAITIQVNYCAIVAWMGRADVPAFWRENRRRTNRARSSHGNRPKSFFLFSCRFPIFLLLTGEFRKCIPCLSKQWQRKGGKEVGTLLLHVRSVSCAIS